MIKLITLDLDNTLWDSDAVIHNAHHAMCDWIIANEPAADALIKSDEQWRSARARIARERRDISHHPSEMRKTITRELLAPLALPEQTLTALVEGGFRIFHEGRNQVVPYPEAVQCLDQLAGRIPLVAVTNGNSNLAHIGLAHYFTGIISAESAGVAKPHPGIFEAALQVTGAHAAEALHVGDHPHEDIAAARQLGFRTLWIRRPEHATQACESDWIADSPAEMCNRLLSLLQATG